MYLQRRNRILRTTPAIRSLVAETVLTPNDFIVPLFIDEGENVKTEIETGRRIIISKLRTYAT